MDEDCSYLLIELIYTNEANAAYFDGIEFCKNALYNNETDGFNQVSSVSKTPETTETSEGSKLGVTSGSNADAYGNVIKSYSTDGLDCMEQSSTYTADGNYLASSTDELGNTTQNTYNTTQYPNNQQFGLIANVQDAKNNIISFYYDAMHRNTSVSQTITNPYFQVTSLSLSNTYTYNNSDSIGTISTANGTQYQYTYDKWGNLATVSVGTTTLATYTYSTDADRRLTQITYANGQSLLFDKSTENGMNYDLIQYKIGSATNPILKVYYNDFGDIYCMYDYNKGLWIKETNGITEEYESNAVDVVVDHSYGQNDITNGTEFVEGIYLSTNLKSTYLKDTGGYSALSTFTINNNIYKQVNHVEKNDSFGRLIAEGTSQGVLGNTVGKSAVVSRYTYKNLPGLKTSNQVASMSITRATDSNLFYKEYKYSYDTVGNITDIYNGANLIAHYEYDEAGQLIRVNDAQQNKTFTYKYDASGNILLKREYAYSTGTLDLQLFTDEIAYTYDANWKDKLTSYDGSPVTYDASGNPLTYNGWTFTWERGRQLKTMNRTGSSITYNYNSDGMRIRKTVNGVSTSYTVVDSKVTSQKTGSDSIYYFYDENDKPVSLNYAGTNYLYVKNLQGDIIAITDIDGNIVVEYTYNAWGKILSTTGSMASTLGVANPFRYRGYYYDVETGLYYLQSRYYNPEWGRFINADDVGYITGYSLFEYCDNNPINRADLEGNTSYIIGGFVKFPVIPDSFNDDEHYTGITKTKFDQLRYDLSKEAIDTLVNFYPNGSGFYYHFYENTGEPYTYNYGEAFNNDDGIGKQVSIEINALVAVAKSKRGNRTQYSVYGEGWALIKPSTIEWKLALGGHNVFLYAYVNYDKNTKLLDFDLTVYAIDRYNFSKSKKFLGIPGSWFVRFESLGMAEYFWSIGSYEVKFQRYA